MRGSIAFEGGETGLLAVAVRLRAAALLGPGIEVPLDGETLIEREALENARVNFWVDDPAEVWELWEGSRRIAMLGNQPVAVSEPDAIGARLYARRPALPNTQPKPLSGPVVRHGAVKRVEVDGNRFVLELRTPFRPGPEHRVVLWDPSRYPILLGPRAEASAADHWSVDLPGSGVQDVAAVAISYKGVWIGGQCLKPSLLDGTKLNDSETDYALRLHAALLRWFRIPVLAPPLIEDVGKSAAAHPIDYIAAWSPGRDSLRWLHPPLDWGTAPDVCWLFAFRSLLFSKWPRDDAQLADIFLKAEQYATRREPWQVRRRQRLGTPPPSVDHGEARANALKTLLRADPLLAALVARATVKCDRTRTCSMMTVREWVFPHGPGRLAWDLNVLREPLICAKACLDGESPVPLGSAMLLLNAFRDPYARHMITDYLFM